MSDQKTPWNPSKTATARVKNPLPAPCECHLCKGSVKIAHHDEIYGSAYGDWPWAYLCQNCGAYVGMHPFTNIPLGTLADAPLRKARKECKQPFELVWRERKLMSRTDAYKALAHALGIPVEECHFGWFDVARCHQARDWSVGVLRGQPYTIPT